MGKSQEQQDHAVARAGRIFAIIRTAAEAGLECPTNAALAESVGYSSTASVSNALSFLALSGMIAVRRSNHTRVVTIMASGATTAGVARKAHHSAKINALVAT